MEAELAEAMREMTLLLLMGVFTLSLTAGLAVMLRRPYRPLPPTPDVDGDAGLRPWASKTVEQINDETREVRVAWEMHEVLLAERDARLAELEEGRSRPRWPWSRAEMRDGLADEVAELRATVTEQAATIARLDRPEPAELPTIEIQDKLRSDYR